MEEKITFALYPEDKEKLLVLARKKGFVLSTLCRFVLLDYLRNEEAVNYDG